MATLCIVVNSSLSIGGWVFGYFVSVREIMVQSFEMDFPQFSGYLEQTTINSKHKKNQNSKDFANAIIHCISLIDGSCCFYVVDALLVVDVDA